MNPTITDMLSTNTTTVATQAIEVLSFATEKLAGGAQAAKPLAETIVREYAWQHIVDGGIGVALGLVFMLFIFWARTKLLSFYAKEGTAEDREAVMLVTTIAPIVLVVITFIIWAIAGTFTTLIKGFAPHYNILLEIVSAAK